MAASEAAFLKARKTAVLAVTRRSFKVIADFSRRGAVALPWLVYYWKLAGWFKELDLRSPLPITNMDYIQYYARALRTDIFMQKSGRIWGYDPFQMGGSLTGIYHEVGTYFPSLICHWLTPILSIRTSLLIVEIAGFALFPVLFWFTIRNLGGDRATATVGVSILAVVYGSFEPFSYYLLNIGLFGFQLATFVALWQVSLFFAWARSRRPGTFTLFAFASAIVFQVHPVALVTLAVPAIVIYVWHFRSFRFRDHACLVGVFVLILLTNWYWISPFLQFAHWRQEAPAFVSNGWKDIWTLFSPVQRTLFLSVEAQVTAALFVWAFLSIRRRAGSDSLRAVLFTVWIGWMALVSFFGSQIPPLESLQPARNTFPLYLIVYACASDYISSLSQRRADFRKLLIVLAVVILAAGHASFMKGPYRSEPVLQNRLPPSQSELLTFLKQNRIPGRLLLETNDWDARPHYSDVVSLLAGCHVLGGPHPGNHMKTRFSLFLGAHFDDENWVGDRPMLFNRPLKNFDSEGLLGYLKLYNVTHVAAAWWRTKELLALHGKILKRIASVAEYEVYEVTRNEPSWFVEGSGDVTCDYDSMSIRSPSQGVLILKFHWLETFRSDPPLPLRPVYVSDDPIPFISVENSSGVDSIRIFNP